MSPTTSPPATVPASSVVPFPTPFMAPAMPPGCCPPDGLAGLNKCYWEVQQAMQFLSAIMVDLLNNDPAVQAALAAGIAKAGPLAIQGATNGVAAPAGTVGETFQNTVASLPCANVYSQQVVNLGILPAGDWLVWVSVGGSSTALPVVTGSWGGPSPPTGFGALTLAGALPAQGIAGSVVSNPCQALISTPTLMNALIGTQGAAAGTFSASVFALRVR